MASMQLKLITVGELKNYLNKQPKEFDNIPVELMTLEKERIFLPEMPYFIALNGRATRENFNEVSCIIPQQHLRGVEEYIKNK